jgi:hypothetical protein
MKNAEDLSGLTVEASWTGKSVGFIPRTIFHKDPSGNLNVEKEVLFFQDFKLSDASPWRSIDEGGSCIQADDWTPGDGYDRINMIGRWWCERYRLHEHGSAEIQEVVNQDMDLGIRPEVVNPISDMRS